MATAKGNVKQKALQRQLTSPAKQAAPLKERIHGDESKDGADFKCNNVSSHRLAENSNVRIQGGVKTNALTMVNVAKGVEFSSEEIKVCKEENKRLSVRWKN